MTTDERRSRYMSARFMLFDGAWVLRPAIDQLCGLDDELCSRLSQIVADLKAMHEECRGKAEGCR